VVKQIVLNARFRPRSSASKEGLHGRTKWAMSVTRLDMWRTDPNPLVTAHALDQTLREVR
jgi:hypothetical protein